MLRAVVRYRRAGTRKWLEEPLRPVGNDRWEGRFAVAELGRWQFTIEAWVDLYATMLDELDRKLAAGQTELASELAEAEALFGPGELEDWHAAAPAARREGAARARRAWTGRSRSDVDRERARFGAWYELFPRSWGGFAGVEKVLPQLAELGFDVLYLPPVHPIGTTNRKGRNNALVAAKGDPGSPWAIGGVRGRPRRAPSRARHDGGVRAPGRDRERARARDRARLRDPVLARPPLARRAPGVVQPAAGRDAQVRREPAQALPGHLQRQLRLPRLAWVVGGAARRRPPLVPARRARVPGRQPAHEVGAVLGVADPPRCAPSSRMRSSSPRPSPGPR